MMTAVNVVLLPYPVPFGSGNGGWQKQKLMRPPPYLANDGTNGRRKPRPLSTGRRSSAC
jgi:hypothetical protein